MENKVGVITLFVGDPRRSKAFYAKAFGLDAEYEDETSAVFRFENILINVVARAAVTADGLIAPAAVADGGSASSLLTIWVESTDAAYAELAGRGVEFVNGPLDRPWGVRTAAFVDPDGHAWEIAQQLGAS